MRKNRFLQRTLLIFFCAIFLGGCAQKRVVYRVPQQPLHDHSSSKSAYAPAAVRLPDSVLLDSRLITFYQQWENVPYRLGGASKKGVDCSAFMQIAYEQLYDKKLPRTAKEQARIGHRIKPEQMRKGDLVFFKTGWRRRHVGMFVGENSFLHVSRQIGVTISELKPTPKSKKQHAAAYWAKRFWCARRL